MYDSITTHRKVDMRIAKLSLIGAGLAVAIFAVDLIKIFWGTAYAMVEAFVMWVTPL